jgi:high-affinity iron transporter
VGIACGLVTAVAMGWLLYLSAVRINLTVFFTWTGLLLILVAAGILKYGVHDLQEAHVLPGLNTFAFDASGWYDPSSWYGALLGGMFNFTATPSVLESIAWVAYAVPVLVLFLVPQRPSAPAPAKVGSTSTSASSAPVVPASDAPASDAPASDAPASVSTS